MHDGDDRLTVGKEYAVSDINDGAIIIVNDRGAEHHFSSHRINEFFDIKK